MLAVYARRRSACLFFIAFLVLGLYLLLNLILAVVFRNYKEQVVARDRHKANQAADRSMHAARMDELPALVRLDWRIVRVSEATSVRCGFQDARPELERLR